MCDLAKQLFSRSCCFASCGLELEQLEANLLATVSSLCLNKLGTQRFSWKVGFRISCGHHKTRGIPCTGLAATVCGDKRSPDIRLYGKRIHPIKNGQRRNALQSFHEQQPETAGGAAEEAR